jgi:hypothetical protein
MEVKSGKIIKRKKKKIVIKNLNVLPSISKKETTPKYKGNKEIFTDLISKRRYILDNGRRKYLCLNVECISYANMKLRCEKHYNLIKDIKQEEVKKTDVKGREIFIDPTSKRRYIYSMVNEKDIFVVLLIVYFNLV